MLKVIRRVKELDLAQLMDVYTQSNLEVGQVYCPHGSSWEQLRCGEMRLRTFVGEFFRLDNALWAVWAPDGFYTAALRVEPYEDGYLLTGLETAPKARGKGHATALVGQMLSYLRSRGACRVYSHVHKQNKVSIAVHKANHFTVLHEYAVLLDGTVSRAYYTLCCNE